MKTTNDSDMSQPQPVRWVPAAKAEGNIVAEIMAGHLRAEEIPVQVWQEGIGEALGLSVGALGTSSIMVPEEYLEQAKEILDVEPETNVLDVACPYCGVELGLDETELKQGWFACPECGEKSNIVFPE
jgi:DNA-directed RNA polymerase subunit RPC12/RpoP